jgi:23S rRNA pseudouridine1911/1915/1917 synthase
MNTNHSFSLSWTAAQEDEGKLLREFLQEKNISKSALTDIKYKGGKIEVNGREVTVRHILKATETIKVLFPLEKPSEGLIPESLPLDIVFEDEFFIVLEKPPYMNTIPSREHPTGSVANGLAGYYKERGIFSTIHVVTRLDRDTSGLMLVAKHRHVHHLMSEQQKQGTVKRTYEAFVHGIMKEQEGKIEAPIGRKATSIIEREVREDGQYACTLYNVLATGQDFSHVELKLLTGRTHQIRVHMAYLGHPLLGDELYGGKRDFINRQALHCKELQFFHPFEEKWLKFTCDLPQDMNKILHL